MQKAEEQALLEIFQLIAGGRFTDAAAALDRVAGPLQNGLAVVINGLNQQMVELICAASEAVERGTQPLLAADQLAADAEVQSRQVAQVAMATEELSASIGEVAENSRRVSETTRGLIARAAAGLEQVSGALAGTVQIGASVTELKEKTGQLTRSVEPIENVLRLIEGISGQTNLLALNAAIEAARAGAHGRGFAVVASEVRRLSERTRAAVGDVRQQVVVLREGARSVEEAVRTVAEVVDRSAELVAGGGAAIREIGAQIREADGPISDIAQAADQQAHAVADAAAGAQEMAKVGTDLQRASGDLDVMVADLQTSLKHVRDLGGKFQLSFGDRELLRVARADHLLWVQRLHEMLLGRDQIRPEQVTDHTECRLGKWYASRGKVACHRHPAFRALEAPHARLHKLAGQAAGAWSAGHRREAQGHVHELEETSREILRLLTELETALADGSCG